MKIKKEITFNNVDDFAKFIRRRDIPPPNEIDVNAVIVSNDGEVVERDDKLLNILSEIDFKRAKNAEEIKALIEIMLIGKGYAEQDEYDIRIADFKVTLSINVERGSALEAAFNQIEAVERRLDEIYRMLQQTKKEFYDLQEASKGIENEVEKEKLKKYVSTIKSLSDAYNDMQNAADKANDFALEILNAQRFEDGTIEVERVEFSAFFDKYDAQ